MKTLREIYKESDQFTADLLSRAGLGLKAYMENETVKFRDALSNLATTAEKSLADASVIKKLTEAFGPAMIDLATMSSDAEKWMTTAHKCRTKANTEAGEGLYQACQKSFRDEVNRFLTDDIGMALDVIADSPDSFNDILPQIMIDQCVLAQRSLAISLSLDEAACMAEKFANDFINPKQKQNVKQNA